MATWVVAKIKTMYFENKTRKESLSTWTLRQGQEAMKLLSSAFLLVHLESVELLVLARTYCQACSA